MASAIVARLAAAKSVKPRDIIVCDIDAKKTSELTAKYGVSTARDSARLAQESDAIVLAVKPIHALDAITGIKNYAADKVFVSIVAGLTTETLKRELPMCRVLRVMPNTPAQVGEGAIVLSLDHTLGDSEFEAAKSIAAALGTVEVVPERLMEAVTAVSGSGPAYVFVMIEAMADAGVRCGLPRDVAYRLAAQTVKGAGSMAMDAHPAILKDAVCSPAGTTIEAIYALEKAGFRGALMDAVGCAYQKAMGIK